MPTSSQVNTVTPMTMLSMAVDQGADIEKLSKLMDLQERWEANESRKAFYQAMNNFKANPPKITKDKHVEFSTSKGKTAYDHATLGNICDVIGKALSQNGLSHRWKTEQGPTGLKVTCILSHVMGYSEEVSLTASNDDSGGKNGVQAIGSTQTYLQRYTLLAATGMATEDQDDDAKAADAAEDPIEAMNACQNLDDLVSVYKPVYEAAKALNNPKLLKTLIEAKDKRKAELIAVAK